MSEITTPPTIVISSPSASFDTVIIKPEGQILVKAASNVTITNLVKQ